jgi:hypothetical protein
VRLVVADPRVLPDDLADDLRAVTRRRLQRTAGSLRRSDSKTRRKAWPVLSTKSKKAVKVAVTRCLLSVLEASALRTVAASASTLSSSSAR